MELVNGKRLCSFTVDWEPYFCFKKYSLFWENNDPLIEEPTHYLLDLLRRHNIKAIFYVVGWIAGKRHDLIEMIKKDGHLIGDHTYYHQGNGSFKPFRSPRWKGEKRLYSGGFWFRVMPYWWIKKEVEKTGIFFIHPHDVMLSHPKEPSLIHNFKRQTGLATSRDKLERLVREIQFDNPS